MKKLFLTLSGIAFIVGIGNGVVSYGFTCYSQYLNFRKPITYIAFPHTVGFYTGRALAHPFGKEKHYETMCDNIFNHTLEGPRAR